MNKISILIPTYNAEPYVALLLQKLEEQKLPADTEKEIIIIDSSSKDKTLEIINNHFTNVKVYSIKNTDFDHGGTRNLLTTKATGNYYLFMTQDAIPANEYLLMNMISCFKQQDVKIVCANQIPKKDASPLEVFARGFNYPEQTIYKSKRDIPTMGIKTFFNSNVCSMYASDLFNGDQFHGFPEKLILNEDLVLSYEVIMAGYTVVYNSEAIVYHSHNYSLKQQFKRYFDIGMAFKQTSYILQSVSNEKEGLKMIRNQQSFLLSRGLFHLIPYSLLESAVKYVAYQIGKRHHLLSYSVKKRLSAYMK